MVRNILTAIAQVISLHYVGSLINSSPKLPGPTEEDSTLPQRGTRDQPADAGKADQEAVVADACPETAYIPRDPPTMPRDAAEHLPDTNRLALTLVPTTSTLTV